MIKFLTTAISIIFMGQSALSQNNASVRLVTLDPGHFHAALVQKSMYPGVDSVVHVYAPPGPDVQFHLDRITSYNSRNADATHWKETVYTGNDFFEKMLADRAGNVAVLSGNNRKKTEYISRLLQSGYHVLADKPMVIDSKNFELLKQSFATAAKQKVLLYDIMTERFEITSMLQRELAMMPSVFGTLQKGTASTPAVTEESVHYFYKYVSGSVLTRPDWFMDITQQGEGIVDVGTHLVDLVQWLSFPGQKLDYTKDINVLSAKRWPTKMTLNEFNAITKLNGFPPFLKKDVVNDTMLNVYSNGEINYTVKGAHARVLVTWAYKAPEGAGDTHYSLMRGTAANLVIKQGAEQQYKPALYIEPTSSREPVNNAGLYEKNLYEQLKKIQAKYPGVDLRKVASGWEVVIPDKYREGHETHFARVTENFLNYLKAGMPAWEVPNMLAKYYTTTKGLELALKNKQ